jgi:hypothetical protein
LGGLGRTLRIISPNEISLFRPSASVLSGLPGIRNQQVISSSLIVGSTFPR